VEEENFQAIKAFSSKLFKALI